MVHTWRCWRIPIWSRGCTVVLMGLVCVGCRKPCKNANADYGVMQLLVDGVQSIERKKCTVQMI